MVYSTLEWRNFLSDAAGGEARYLVADDQGRLVGVLPSFHRHASQFGTVVNSLPWFGSHGGCTLAPNGPEPRRLLLTEFARTLPADLVSATVVLTPEETADAASSYYGVLGAVAEDTRTGQVTELPAGAADPEARLEELILQKTRNLVRKSLRQQFERVCTLDAWAWDFLVDLHTRNISAIGGKAKPASHFGALKRSLPARWLRLSVALHRGKPVAALLLVRYNRTVEYLIPVVEHEARPQQAMSFLIWHELLDAARDGFRWWNWGGTWASQRSLHHFKRGWGAVDRPYSYVVAVPEDRREWLRSNASSLADGFPYYYVYPFAS
jgi:hypothetical protein